MQFICYTKCTTCQKAKQFLDAHALPYTLRNIKEENPTYEELKTFIQEELGELFWEDDVNEKPI